MIDNTIVTTWGIMGVIGLIAWLLSRKLSINPGLVQTAVEGMIASIENVISEVAPQHVKSLTPFIGSLWIFLVIANLSGLIPGVHSPTRDLSATSALAIVVFLSTHWFGICL
ncbi:ATP synthase subunit A, partial [Vibrio xuii]